MVRFIMALAIAGTPLAISAAVAQSDQSPPRWMANIARKQQAIMNGVPLPYGDMRDPAPDTRACG